MRGLQPDGAIAIGSGNEWRHLCKSARHRRRPLQRLCQRRNLLCAEDLFINGPPFDEVVADMIAESRSLRSTDCSLWRDSDFRFDDVFDPVALAGRDVAGKGVAGKSGDGDVVSAADTTFEHAAAPDGNILAEAVGLDVAGAGVAADATEFDVDDAAGAEFDGDLRVAKMVDGFVQA